MIIYEIDDHELIHVLSLKDQHAIIEDKPCSVKARSSFVFDCKQVSFHYVKIPEVLSVNLSMDSFADMPEPLRL